MNDARTGFAALLRFYDDDHGPCASFTVSRTLTPTTLAVPAGADEVTVELVLPEPGGLAGSTDAEVLEAAGRLVARMGEAGPHITTTRSVLAMAAERAREANEPSPAELSARSRARWGGT